MRDFKLFRGFKKELGYEMMINVRWVPETLMGHESWSFERSSVMREWLSDFYYNGCREEDMIMYVPQIDRTCRVVEWNIRSDELDWFRVTVWIMRSRGEYLEIDLTYAIN